MFDVAGVDVALAADTFPLRDARAEFQKMLGKDVLAKIRKADIAKTKTAAAKAKPRPEPKKGSREPRTSEELEKFIFGED